MKNRVNGLPKSNRIKYIFNKLSRVLALINLVISLIVYLAMYSYLRNIAIDWFWLQLYIIEVFGEIVVFSIPLGVIFGISGFRKRRYWLEYWGLVLNSVLLVLLLVVYFI